MGSEMCIRDRSSRQPIGCTNATLPFKVTYTGYLKEKDKTKAGEHFSLVRLGLATWSLEFMRPSLAAFVDISVGSQCPTMVVMGMRVVTPRHQLKCLRRMLFHEQPNYNAWLMLGDDKQKRRFEYMLKMSFVEDFKHIQAPERGIKAVEGLLQRWANVRELLLLDEPEKIREVAEESTPQLSFFLLVSARVLVAATAQGKMRKHDAWLEHLVLPLSLIHI